MPDHASALLTAMSTIFFVAQIFLLVFFVFGTTYSAEEFKVEE